MINLILAHAAAEEQLVLAERNKPRADVDLAED